MSSTQEYGPPEPPPGTTTERSQQNSKELATSDINIQAMFPLPSGLRGNAPSFRSMTDDNTMDKYTKTTNEDEYFNSADVDEKQCPASNIDLEYQPGSDSPTNANNEVDQDDDDDDDLDSYMNRINAEAKYDLKTMGKRTKERREDLEAEDHQETFFRWLEDNPNAGVSLQTTETPEDNRDLDFDEDGNIIVPEKSRWIDPLSPIDHSEIKYAPFTKNFYNEHPEISELKPAEVTELCKKLGVTSSGYNPPKPVSSFAHFGFDSQLMSAIRKAQFVQPTGIQAQSVPAILSGRDIIGIGKTGSGKTCAFIWPALVHIMDQPNLKEDDGPIALIIVPTRELAQQIHVECKRYGRVYNIRTSCAFGGSNLHDQSLSCKSGTCEIIVATPGRLIDLVKKESVVLTRVTLLVLDEADRLFDMGFEPQVRSIVNHIRPDRQCLLFSATFKQKIERLCSDVLCDPVRIVHGSPGEANENITQIVEVLKDAAEKWSWLTRRLVQFTSHGKLLIFVTRRENCEILFKSMKEHGYPVKIIHGEIPQFDRDRAIEEFKSGNVQTLVATDVASRGLDIKNIKTIVNYDVAKDVGTHIHRVGRTARAGEKGFAFTLVTEKDKEFAPHLVRNLEQSSQYVPPELMNIALTVPWFSNTRLANSKAKKLNVGGAGLGYRERPSENMIGPMADYRGVSLTGGRLSGPQGHRVSALKSAFQSQFKSNFVAASEDSQPTDYPSRRLQDSDEASSSSKRSINNDANNQSCDTPKKKKKSRWDD